MRAACLLKREPHYRHAAFEAGLVACGFDVGPVPRRWEPGDLLVIWNRQRGHHFTATDAEQHGATVIVTENGYIGADDEGRHLFALAVGHHNGAGRWPVGGPERWAALDVTLKPWREDGDHVLVLPQRGIGAPDVAMPKIWPFDVYDRLTRMTGRPVRVRQHPGMRVDGPSLDEDLRGAWCAVTWGSSAALKALAAGVPVFHEMRQWIGAPAARLLCDGVEDVALPDRLPMFQRLAWAQASAAEIATGEPFRRLLAMTVEKAAA